MDKRDGEKMKGEGLRWGEKRWAERSRRNRRGTGDKNAWMGTYGRRKACCGRVSVCFIAVSLRLNHTFHS